jgi:hypothetical protein
MACPYFLPRRRLSPIDGIPGWKMPLGSVFAGECTVVDGEAWTPSDSVVRTACNTGYPRGQCDRFPQSAKYDIVRFLVTEDHGTGGSLSYVYEKDHYPALCGDVRIPAEGSSLLEIQATSYWNSYKDWKCKAAL